METKVKGTKMKREKNENYDILYLTARSPRLRTLQTRITVLPSAVYTCQYIHHITKPTPANISITFQHLKTNHPNEKFSGPNISHIIADFDYYRVDHTMDLVVLMKYGGDWVSITLNATPELFASGAAFGSPPEPVKQIMSFLSHQKCVNNIQKC